MSEQRTPRSAGTTLDDLTLALMVGSGGECSNEAVGDLRRYAESKKLMATTAEFTASLDRARESFNEGESHLFLCDGKPCHRRRQFDGSAATLQQEAERIGCRVTSTACQGPCKEAPVATLRVGRQCEMFTQFSRPSHWQTLLEFATRASGAGTLQIESESVEPFRYDPHHEAEKPSPVLLPLKFLVGRFEGTVELPEERRSIHKQVVGSWETGGRFLALRMAATYQQFDGNHDRHQALVLVGADPDQGGFLSRAYTDVGSIVDFHLEVDGARLRFADRVPHGISATAARKVLVPAGDGYDESLELDRGFGRFDPYYTIPMRRT